MYNKKNYLLLATMILMVLVGCQTANNEVANPQDATATPAVEATATPTVDVTPTEKPEPTETPVATATPEATPTAEPTVAPTETPVPTAEPTATATPVPTATSTPTPTPKFTFKDMDKELYAKSSVNVRSLPSSEGDKLGSLSAWEKVKVTGQCNETSWYRIKYGDGIGYVSNNYLVTNKPTPTPTATPVPTATPIPEYVYTELDCVMYSTAVGTIYRVPGGYPIRGGVEETFTAGTEFKVTGWCDKSSCYRVEYEGGYGYKDGVGYIYEYYLTDNKSDPNVVTELPKWLEDRDPVLRGPWFYSVEVDFGGHIIKFPSKDYVIYSATNAKSGSVDMVDFETDWSKEYPLYRIGYELCDYDGPEEFTSKTHLKWFGFVSGFDKDFIIETEFEGRPCYILVDEQETRGDCDTRYTILQEIDEGVALTMIINVLNQPEMLNYYVEKIDSRGMPYRKLTFNKEAHLARVLPYLITQDQIQ